MVLSAAGWHDSEEEVKSQWSVDGSVASLHSWLVDFEDTLGDMEDSITRHIGKR